MLTSQTKAEEIIAVAIWIYRYKVFVLATALEMRHDECASQVANGLRTRLEQHPCEHDFFGFVDPKPDERDFECAPGEACAVADCYLESAASSLLQQAQACRAEDPHLAQLLLEKAITLTKDSLTMQ